MWSSVISPNWSAHLLRACSPQSGQTTLPVKSKSDHTLLFHSPVISPCCQNKTPAPYLGWEAGPCISLWAHLPFFSFTALQSHWLCSSTTKTISGLRCFFTPLGTFFCQISLLIIQISTQTLVTSSEMSPNHCYSSSSIASLYFSIFFSVPDRVFAYCMSSYISMLASRG